MRKVIILTFLIVFISCNHSDLEQSNIISIDLNTIENNVVNLTEFCSSVEYIELETKPVSIIKNIGKIKFFGDSIFILNELGWNLNEILIFDSDGRFLSKFGNIGIGPEEINNPRDFIKFGESILVWDREKVCEFDKKGNFQRKLFNAFVHGNNFFVDSNFVYLFHGTEFPGLLTKYNLNGKIIDTLKPTNPLHQNTAFEFENIAYANNEFHFFAPAFDTVWTIKNNKIIPKYFLDFKTDITLEEFFNKIDLKDPMQRLNALNSNPTSSVIRFLENDNYIFMYCRKSKDTFFKILNKQANRSIAFKSCYNNIDNGMFSNPISLSEKGLLTVLEPTKILRYYKKNSNNPKDKFLEICRKINEDSNPVIMICNLELK